ncbi:hypothetical protein vseg_009186 [Gypsophila vaccaria]
MARERDNDVAEITSLSQSIPNNIISAISGGRMATFGAATNAWSVIPGGNNIRYIHADSVANFSVGGQASMSSLVPGWAYRGTFELELTRGASGWPGNFSVALSVPGSRRAIQPRERAYNQVGSFRVSSNIFQLAAPPSRNATLGFTLSHTGQYRRTGLIVKRFVIQEA